MNVTLSAARRQAAEGTETAVAHSIFVAVVEPSLHQRVLARFTGVHPGKTRELVEAGRSRIVVWRSVRTYWIGGASIVAGG